MSAVSNAAITGPWIVCSLTVSPVSATVSASSPSSSSSSVTAVKTYHDGSRRDLDEIGNRNDRRSQRCLRARHRKLVQHREVDCDGTVLCPAGGGNRQTCQRSCDHGVHQPRGQNLVRN